MKNQSATSLPDVSRVSPKPSWTNDESEPEFNSCAEALWKLAEKLAAKFVKGGERSIICGFSREDLASEAILYFFIKLRAGKFKNYRPEAMWGAARECMWHRIIDIVTRPANQNQKAVQAPLDDNGTPLDPDEALETLDQGRGGTWGQSFRRAEIQALEEFVDSLLDRLPRQMRQLLSLRYGLYRTDPFGVTDNFGNECPVTGEPYPLEVLVDLGYGESVPAVHRRIKDALERLRALALDVLRK